VYLLWGFRIELQHRPGLLLEHRVQGREEPVKTLDGVLLAGVRIAQPSFHVGNGPVIQVTLPCKSLNELAVNLPLQSRDADDTIEGTGTKWKSYGIVQRSEMMCKVISKQTLSHVAVDEVARFSVSLLRHVLFQAKTKKTWNIVECTLRINQV